MGLFSWYNRRKDFCQIAERLDRFIFKGNLRTFYYAVQSVILPNAGSDHFPVSLEIEGQQNPSINPFKCKEMWFLDENFMKNIQQWWQEDNFEGLRIFCFVSKLKLIKRKHIKMEQKPLQQYFKRKIGCRRRPKKAK